MYKVYGDYRSGNCYKIKLMLELLGLPYEWVAVDILKGETQSEAFLAKNPNGKIPVLELEDGTCLWESNAILNFLADGSEFLPTEPRLRTQVLQCSSSSSTATSPMSRWRVLFSCIRGCRPNGRRSTRNATCAATRPSRSWSCN